MKILIITHNISSGGASTACRRLINAFKSQEIDVELLSIKEKTNSKSIIGKLRRIYCGLISKFDIQICKYLSPGGGHWKSSGLIGVIKARNIRSANPTVVNIHWIGHATISIRQLEKIQIPTVITMHDEWWMEKTSHYSSPDSVTQRNLLAKFVLNNLLKRKRNFLLRENVQVVCLSNEMKIKLEKFLDGHAHKTHIVPNPVSTYQFHRVFLQEGVNKILLFAGGNSDPRKGFDLFESALNQMKEPCLVMAPGLVGVREYGVRNQIRMHGIPKVTSFEQMNLLYNQSDLCVVPSRQEALPQVATESLMAGTPVAGFEVGGLRDIIIDGFNGLKVEKFDTSKMALKIDQFLLTSSFNHAKIAADAKLRFSEETVVNAYRKILEK